MPSTKPSARKYDLLYKVLVIGESGIGKTALIRCISQPEKAFSPSLVSTIGIDFVNVDVEVDDLNIRLQIWDTAGQEKFRTLNTLHFRGTKGVILVYDITNEASFAQLQYWLKSLKEHGLLEEELILVGNKSDLDSERRVSIRQGEKLAKHHGLSFFETSAKTKQNVEKVFHELAAIMKYANNPYERGRRDTGSDFDMVDGIVLPSFEQPHYPSPVHSSSYCCRT